MADQVKQYLLRISALKPGEAGKTLLLGLYLFLVIATYLIAKSVRDGLFLDRYGAFKLPYVIIGIAVAVGIFVAVYIRLARRIEPTRLVVGTLVLFISNLVLFWWMIRAGVGWVYPTIYIWAGMYGAIAPAQVWTLANDVFTTRQAKRTFGIVGSGGILGAIFGSYLTREFALRIGTTSLLLIMALLLLLAAIVVLALSRHRIAADAREGRSAAPRHMMDSLKLISASPHLRLIAGLVFITALATTMADFQFKAVAVEKLAGDPDRLTAFFGTFYGTVGVLSFVVQFLITSRLLRRLGLGGSILLLPLALFAASILLIPTMALYAAVMLKGSDAAMKHSVDRSTRELAYLPVDRRIKIHVKSAIDMVVDRLGDGTGGVILLVLISLFGFGLRGVIYANLVFIVAWLFIAVRLRASYLRELSRSIREGRIEIGSWDEALAGSEMLDALGDALESGDQPRVLAALDLVARNPSWDFRQVLNRLATKGCEEVRARATAILLRPEEPDLPVGIAGTFQEEDRALFSECIDFMAADGFEEKEALANTILRRAGGSARGVWVALMLRRLGDEFLPFGRALLEHLAHADSTTSSREAAATAIGMMPLSSDLSALLPDLLQDREQQVVEAAASSAGAIGSDSMLRLLVEQLGRQAGRLAARQAFLARGDEVIPMLTECIREPALPMAIRRHIPSLLGAIGSERAVCALLTVLDDPERSLSSAAREALYRHRLPRPEIPLVSRQRVEDKAMELARRYRDLGTHLEEVRLVSDGDPAARALLVDTLEEARGRERNALFQVLSLYYPPADIQNCRRSMQEHDMERRSNAEELMDNLSPGRLWHAILPILYPETAVRRKERHTGPGPDLEQSLAALARDPDPWISACALNLAAGGGHNRLVEIARERDMHPDYRVREAARRTGGGGQNMVTESAGVFDKIMALKNVDLFSGAPTEQLSLIAALARIVEFPEGAELCRQNDPAGDLFIVLSGSASLLRDGETRGRLITGEALGTWGLFEDEPRQVTVQAVEPMQVLRIDRWGFDQLLFEHPEVSRSLIRLMVKRLRNMTR
ncbi:MAG: cyclic nucleotide-binding domain-containing protein [Acidobacteria bacterium]|uniref:ADP,ATP carrier protein n=1 Tax=Candidatus Polarisedimenticola svalbardensis TaxID=2886004 RepID=A0A8J6XZ74_9BACT|nr:cyclic nucleotide-binding domain-containing protein [Candidatus Polarisedimenticola svalbardensis]